MIDPKDFALSLGNPMATHVFIEKVNKEFEKLQSRIEALESASTEQSVQTKKTSKAV